MIRGSCLCGQVKYELDGGVELINNCHCSMCRKAHGAAFGSFLHASSTGFRWSAGENLVERYPSSAGNVRAFCRVCGSRMPVLEDGNHVIIPAGTLDDDPGARPIVNIFVGSKAPWFDIEDSLPRFNEFPPKEFWETAATTSTVRLHRVLRATPERIYRAFLDAGAMAKWLPPNGFTGKVHHLDARVGGTYKMSFTNFTSGHSHSFGGEYLELVPHERIRHTDKFDDPNLPGEMQTTVWLKKVSCGTELNVVQEGIPSAIPVEACYLGWQESLTLLAQLVEAEIPG